MGTDKTMENTTDTATGAAGLDGVSTMSVVRYPVAPGYRVNVRSGPGTQYRIVRTLAQDVRVPIYCQTTGEWVSGPYGTTNIWDNIAAGEFISDAYVKTGSDGLVAKRCG
ncbi:SH3 domain-containing protein [Streptomyces sp. P9(2023)]|uniref:SH3 domain-containing protein n=1 Tax=Streptomyces sp. P9(2023) TaxID=3064394 RepID=UPI0028F42749|nr:SH3 domain-containing protein [Streptomyces sp. P9(2023)]MDT9689664.1 SH3 domain-containing protein [Streptomyces sp. P9(2023)]